MRWRGLDIHGRQQANFWFELQTISFMLNVKHYKQESRFLVFLTGFYKALRYCTF